MPVLFPYVLHGAPNLHPTEVMHDRVTHTPRLIFVFQNFGKTAGKIRQVRADLLLVGNDALPESVNFENLPLKIMNS